jgi:hypothetical protein
MRGWELSSPPDVQKDKQPDPLPHPPKSGWQRDLKPSGVLRNSGGFLFLLGKCGDLDRPALGVSLIGVASNWKSSRSVASGSLAMVRNRRIIARSIRCHKAIGLHSFQVCPGQGSRL